MKSGHGMMDLKHNEIGHIIYVINRKDQKRIFSSDKVFCFIREFFF